MNRVSWNAIAENPAVKGYKNFIKNMAEESAHITGKLQNCRMVSYMTT